MQSEDENVNRLMRGVCVGGGGLKCESESRQILTIDRCKWYQSRPLRIDVFKREMSLMALPTGGSAPLRGVYVTSQPNEITHIVINEYQCT